MAYKPRPNIFTIENWVHDPKRRKHRFRCAECQKLVDDGTTLIVERRGTSSHGYHGDCFHTGQAGAAAAAREFERLNGGAA